jgi:hypothetical protein
MSGRLIILGASGHGKVAADIVMRSGYEEILFLDDSPQAGSCLGWPVLGPVSEAEDLQGDFLWPLETPRCGRAPKPTGRAGEGPCHPDSPLRRPGNRSQRRLRQRPHGGSHRQSLHGKSEPAVFSIPPPRWTTIAGWATMSTSPVGRTLPVPLRWARGPGSAWAPPWSIMYPPPRTV